MKTSRCEPLLRICAIVHRGTRHHGTGKSERCDPCQESWNNGITSRTSVLELRPVQHVRAFMHACTVFCFLDGLVLAAAIAHDIMQQLWVHLVQVTSRRWGQEFCAGSAHTVIQVFTAACSIGAPSSPPPIRPNRIARSLLGTITPFQVQPCRRLVHRCYRTCKHTASCFQDIAQCQRNCGRLWHALLYRPRTRARSAPH